MTLDITRVASQVGEMLDKLKADNRLLLEHLQYARDTVNDPNLNIEKLKRKIASSRGSVTYLVAGLYDGFNHSYPAPQAPPEFSVLATDGSHIDMDRNRAVRCYLINIGRVFLHYGADPQANLESLPHLYCRPEELQIADSAQPGQRRPMDSTLLGVLRGVEEMEYLADLASQQARGSRNLALVDGTLVRWGLESYPDYITDELLKRRFLGSLEKVRMLNESQDVALASYISLPRSTEVVNALRVAVCPQDAPDCDRCRQVAGQQACDAVDGVQDQMLFSAWLKPGERSDLFFSQSSLVEKYYGVSRIYFFYLRVEDEIARVEVPEWLIRKPGLLDLTHVLVLDQCRRGQGYPVALSEAHEKAVVSGSDREEFWALVDESMLEEKMSTETSLKSQSKKSRWV